MREYLRKRRKEMGMTGGEVADKLNISMQYYHMIENDERKSKMDIALARKLSEALDLPLGTIIDEEIKKECSHDSSHNG